MWGSANLSRKQTKLSRGKTQMTKEPRAKFRSCCTKSWCHVTNKAGCEKKLAQTSKIVAPNHDARSTFQPLIKLNLAQSLEVVAPSHGATSPSKWSNWTTRKVQKLSLQVMVPSEHFNMWSNWNPPKVWKLSCQIMVEGQHLACGQIGSHAKLGTCRTKSWCRVINKARGQIKLLTRFWSCRGKSCCHVSSSRDTS